MVSLIFPERPRHGELTAALKPAFPAGRIVAVILAASGLAIPALASSGAPTCTIRTLLDDGLETSQRPISVDFSGVRSALESYRLTAENPDGGSEIFVIDRRTGLAEQVSHTSYPDERPFDPAISGDGARVAYQLQVSTVADELEALILADRATHFSKLISSSSRPVLFQPRLSGDGSRLVFVSDQDLTGDNPSRQDRVFLYDARDGSYEQLTQLSFSEQPRIDFSGAKVLIYSYEDQLGDFPYPWPQLYLYDVATGRLGRVTASHGNVGPGDLSGDGRTAVYDVDGRLQAFDVPTGTVTPLLDGVVVTRPAVNFDGTRISFVSSTNVTGENPGEDRQVFLYDRLADRLVQVTRGESLNTQSLTAINGPGDVLVFPFRGNPDGGPSDFSVRVFSASCTLGPQPPPGPGIRAPGLEDFELRVRFSTTGGQGLAGTLEPGCIPETACFSGSIPGRSELFLRVVGPKPNGFLWPTLVKFSTSRWRSGSSRLSTGVTRLLPAAGSAAGAR